ncbi:hypothetical protein ACFWXO_16415 [Kitasatospora sp. NPDC059088]|uniref:hypothetical protein n=1 Tax=Kitasatospora sp. NPDC059088 TaxID=3346722 RepID=UPI00369F9909
MTSDNTRFHEIIQTEGRLDRDRRLILFLRERIAESADTATERERALLAAVGRILAHFADGFEAAALRDSANGVFGHYEALGWSLRCTAFAAFSEHPGFSPDWRP